MENPVVNNNDNNNNINGNNNHDDTNETDIPIITPIQYANIITPIQTAITPINNANIHNTIFRRKQNINITCNPPRRQ